MEEQVGCAQPGDVELGEAVVVDIAPGDAFDKTLDVQTDFCGDIGEGAVALVAEEFTGVVETGGGFVAEEEIEMTVVVEVGPGGRLRGVQG